MNNNKKITSILLASSLIGVDEYMPYINDECFEDNEVCDCLMKMYFYMLISPDEEEKKEKMFQEFRNKYHKLNEKQQELVKQDYINIINAQDKYDEENEKIKVKKKGMINYE